MSGPSHLFLEPYLWEPGLALGGDPHLLFWRRGGCQRGAQHSGGRLSTWVTSGRQDGLWLPVPGLRCRPPPPALQHYLCCSDVPVPRISVIFSLEELKDIEKDCATYVGRMERVARHSSVSKEEKVRAPQPGLPWPSLSSPPGAGWALGGPILAGPWLQGSRA